MAKSKIRELIFAVVSLPFLFWFGSNTASAQTQAQFNAVTQAARLVSIGPLCEKLGFKLTANMPNKLQSATTAELMRTGMQRQRAEALEADAMARASKDMRIDLAAEVKRSTDSKNLVKFLEGRARQCLDASQDRTFSMLITAPTTFDSHHAAVRVADGLLSVGGLASWQTAAIRVRGDLLMTAGACRSYIGDRADALFSKYASSDNAREREYYVQSYDNGLSDKSLNLDSQQCERALAGFERKVRGH